METYRKETLTICCINFGIHNCVSKVYNSNTCYLLCLLSGANGAQIRLLAYFFIKWRQAEQERKKILIWKN